MEFTFTELNTSTWDAFAELVERNNGIFGGCWCTAFHSEGQQRGLDRRAIPEVTAGREAQGRFLYSATVELFEDFGFTRRRQVGKHAWIVSRTIEGAS